MLKLSSRLGTAALAGVMGLSLAAPTPARADGAASTRNIIFGAAAIGGTLLVINHNKKVHQRYAEYDRRQAQAAAERNQAQAAYSSERRAYEHEVAINRDLEREVAYEHRAVRERDKQIASLKHSLIVAKYGRIHRTAYVPEQPRIAPRPAAVHNGPPVRAQVADSLPQSVSYGWGKY
ncbi:MAG: hypothetical protein NVS2B8_07890 [Vulcanimicrobiaceae bacterium]